MRRFHRQKPPPVWARFEEQWLKALGKARAEGHTAPVARDKLGRRHRDGVPSALFHAMVRPGGEQWRCAYCDGELGVQSPETIDHFAPEGRFPELGLCWRNLFPSCVVCNSICKGARLSCALVRPDVDPVDEWFDFNPVDGRVRVSPAVKDRIVMARVRLTILVLGLNRPKLCLNRRRAWRNLVNAFKSDDKESIKDAFVRGPYLFVIERFTTR